MTSIYIASVLFWTSLLLVIYTYWGYPILLTIVSRFKNNRIDKSIIYPPITIMIVVYNGESRIREKLKNTLELDYPRDKVEILVVSDGSTDKTNEIVREYSTSNIKLLDLNTRNGKEASQKIGIQHSNGEIIVCTDVGAILHKDALVNIMMNFNDESVGCVSGEDYIISGKNTPSTAAEGTYGNYELSIRWKESIIKTMIGVSGCFFAVRKELTSSWPEDVPSDFMVPLMVIKSGKRVVTEPNALCAIEAVKSLSAEYTRKIRTIIRGMTVFFRRKELLNPFDSGFVAVQLISHKLMRWLIPVFSIVILVSNYYLIEAHLFYKYLMVLQVSFYVFALLSVIIGLLKYENRISRLLSFFIMSNAATLVAWYKYLTGQRKAIWEPSKR